MTMAVTVMNLDADFALQRLIRVRQQIDLIDEQIWDMETRLNLAEICDVIIDLMQNDHSSNRRVAYYKFSRILNRLIGILRRWHNDTITFRNFMGESVDKAEDTRNRGNETQIMWTGVNCLANAAGLAAIFIPGLNVPLMVAGIGGSIIGVYKRIESDKKNKREFAEIMNEIEVHNDYKMLSFSDVITQKQRQFEESRSNLIENYNFDMNAANVVATLQMIIDSMLNNMIMPRQQQQGIQTEIAADIVSQIKNLFGVAFQRYGRHMFNLMDDAFEATVGAAKGLSFALVGVTFAINFTQLLNESKDRAEKVRRVTKMKDKLQCGADSIQFFINTMGDIRDHINSISLKDIEEELEQVKKNADRTSQQVAEHGQLFIEFKRFLQNNATDGNDNRDLHSIDFTEP